MKYSYVMSERMRSVTFFDFTDKTVCGLIECNNGDFEPDTIYSWDKSPVKHGVGILYAGIEELTEDFDEDDVIISSDLRLSDICERLNKPEYSRWDTSCNVCFKMLKAYSNPKDRISLEDLIKAMQQ